MKLHFDTYDDYLDRELENAEKTSNMPDHSSL